MSRIICIGSASKDMFFPTDEGVVFDTPEDVTAQRKIAFELGAKYHIDERAEALGGCSTNVATGISRLGEEAHCYASVGDDQIGQWIVEKMGEEKISTQLIAVQNACKSDLSSILIDKKSGERVIFSNQVSNKLLAIDEEKIVGYDWVFIGDLSGRWQDNLDKIVLAAKKSSIPIAFNPRQKTIHEDVGKIIEIINACEILFLNKDEAIEIVLGIKNDVSRESLNNEKFLLEVFRKIGVGMVVITDGTRGGWAYDGKEMLHVDAMVRKAVDTTGAGDAFTSGFFAAYIKGKGIGEALKWGIVNSSNSVLFYGGQEGLLGEDAIISLIENVKVENI